MTRDQGKIIGSGRSTLLGRSLAGLSTAVAAVTLMCGADSANAQQKQQQIGPQALQQIDAIYREKATWTPVQRKMTSDLILEAKRRTGRALAQGMPDLRSSLEMDDAGRALVDITAIVNDALLVRIQRLGGQVVNSYAQYDAIRAWMPIVEIETLAARGDVRSIRNADRAASNKINTSEGLIAHRADVAQAQCLAQGSGVKVGVLSDSVDFLAQVQASGDLPAVTVLPGQSGVPASGEGTAMLEIVYDLAPGADLLFATAFGGQPTFAANIAALRAAGADVIVDDIFYFTEPVFDDGPIAQAVDAAVASGAIFFSSAGNAGNLNDGTSGVWEGDFRDSGSNLGGLVSGNAHDFTGGGVLGNIITKDPPFAITLHWSDFTGTSANDYDLFLMNAALTVVIDASVTVQDGNDAPVEIISSPANDLGNAIVVTRKAGAADRFLHVNTLRGQLTIATDGQTAGHSAAVGACGVAAVNGTNGPFSPADVVETFSSDGFRRVFYDTTGFPLTPGDFSSTGGEVRMKPDIAAADGVATATPGFAAFFGTSAAAPHAAAIAALMIEKNPFASVTEIKDAMIASAIDIEAVGFDRDSGAGIVDAVAAIQALPLVVCCLPDGSCAELDPCACMGMGGAAHDVASCADIVCEREHPGWNFLDNGITLTANEPTYWSALTGLPKGVSPFTALDPGGPMSPGRPAMDGTSDRVLRGYVLAWAVNNMGDEIRWNHLKGEGTIINYRDNLAWEYNAYTHQSVNDAIANGEPIGTPGELHLDGTEYSVSFDELLLNFQAAGAAGFSAPGFPTVSNTDLTLFPVPADLRQNNDGPVTTKASMDIWNENEVKFSGTHRCITCWDQTLIGRYDTPNSFLFPFLQTMHGKARIDGHAADVCNVLDDPETPEDESVTSIEAPLLGVAARLLAMNSVTPFYNAAAGSNLIGMGTDDTAVIQYDVTGGGGGPPEAQSPEQAKEQLLSWLDREAKRRAGIGVGGGVDSGPVEAQGPFQDRVSATEKGSLVIFPKVEIRWDMNGVLVQDTFLSLTNDFPKDVEVQMYFINGDAPFELEDPVW